LYQQIGQLKVEPDTRL